MTPLPDQQVAQSETLEQIAERIIRELFVIAPDVSLSSLHPTYFEDYNVVLSALRNEREACAKLLDVRVVEISNYQTRPYRVARRELEAAAMSIREGR